MAQRTCIIDDCDSPRFGHGYCNKHYKRWRKNGDPHDYGTRVIGDDVARFWHYVDRNGPTPVERPDLGRCWLWTGYTDRDGYGHLRINGADALAHRHSWELHHGPLAEGHEADHLCFVRDCVNPAHLEPVTRAENNRRMNARRNP